MTIAGVIPYRQVPLRRFIVDITDGPFGSSLTSSHYSDEGARVIRLGNIGAAQFKDSDAAYISLEYFNELRRHEVLPGDLIIAGLGDGNHPVGRACVAPNNLGPAIVKADCFRVRLDEERLTHIYAAWALSSSFVSDQVSSLTRGSTRARINLEVAREIKLPIPPVEEQHGIAEFLDGETARIDDLVERKRRMRDLLALRRERLIEEVLGLTQQRGDLAPLNYLVQEITVGIVITPAKWYVDHGGVTALRGVNVRPGKVVLDDVVQISAKGHAEHHKSTLHAGDVVVVRTGQAGAAAVVPQGLNGSNCIDLILIRPGEGIFARYLEYVLNSEYARRHVAEYSVGSIQAHFNVGAMKKLPIPRIPVEEQRRLAAELERRVGSIESLMTKIDDQLGILAERRQALIAAAVTGQIDVAAFGRASAGRHAPRPFSS
ncbi:restriction endonuclease subunit S [Streptomyces bacillaris]|uniref:restriction endonuclease subunit S n=1 Tax=Streptomyces bacillaris TaxID=68179 RepID=UPI00345FD725